MGQLALAVAAGGKAWSAIDIEEGGDVLYMALEDYDRRMKFRFGNFLQEEAPPERLHFTYYSDIDRDDLEAQIYEWAESKDNVKLIVVDTMAKAEKAPSKHADTYYATTESVAKWQALAVRYECAIVFVHHFSKWVRDAEDIFDAVLGSTGITGAADTLLALTKKDTDGRLHVRGRDVGDMVYAMEFDPDMTTPCPWVFKGEAARYEATSEQQEIIDVFLQSGSDRLTMSEITSYFDPDQKPKIQKRVQRMAKSGILVQPVKRGPYMLPHDAVDTHVHNVLSDGNANENNDLPADTSLSTHVHNNGMDTIDTADRMDRVDTIDKIFTREEYATCYSFVDALAIHNVHDPMEDDVEGVADGKIGLRCNVCALDLIGPASQGADLREGELFAPTESYQFESADDGTSDFDILDDTSLVDDCDESEAIEDAYRLAKRSEEVMLVSQSDDRLITSDPVDHDILSATSVGLAEPEAGDEFDNDARASRDRTCSHFNRNLIEKGGVGWSKCLDCGKIL
jgi:hypothetical protein